MPQSWNRYTYGFNNPLRFIDPTGLWNWDASAGGLDSDMELLRKQNDKRLRDAERDAAKIALQFRGRFRKAREAALRAAMASGDPSTLAAVLAYGEENDGNGVLVGVRALAGNDAITLDPRSDDVIRVFFDPAVAKSRDFAGTVGHEGRHIGDWQDWFQTHCTGCATDLNDLSMETRAWNVSGILARYLGMKSFAPYGGGKEYQVWNRGWAKADEMTILANRNAAIQRILRLYQGPGAMDPLSLRHPHRP